MAASRKVGSKEQRIMILGDADFISNSGIAPPTRRWPVSNFSMIPGMFRWLSYGNVPVDVSRPNPEDNDTSLTKKSLHTLKVLFLWVLPGLVLIGGTVLLIRRKRK
jgi:ABC-2 type transport system permease protein